MAIISVVYSLILTTYRLEARSDDVTDNNIAYSRKQGFSDLRELINLAFSGFQSYDYYRADTVSADEAGSIYERRISSLKEWLVSDEIKDRFTDNEKEYLVRQYDGDAVLLYLRGRMEHAADLFFNGHHGDRTGSRLPCIRHIFQ